MSTVSARQLIHQLPELRGSASSSSSGPAAAAETAAQCNGMVAAQQRSSAAAQGRDVVEDKWPDFDPGAV